MIKPEQAALLIGKNIELICFAQYSIYLHIEGRILVTVEAGLEHFHDGKRDLYELSSPLASSSLLTMLDNKITAATVDTSGDLQLSISNGDMLRIYKEPPYESYRLRIGEEELTA